MDEFEAKTVCILGRQPKLGLAELESVYGPTHVRPFGDHALLDVPAEEIGFKRLGGTIKVARILAERPQSQWPELETYLVKTVPPYVKQLPQGKFTLGLSVYGISVPVKKIEAVLLEIKKRVRQSGRPVRIVPNQSSSLNSAQVLHNKLIHKGAWELCLIKHGARVLVAQTLFVQDINAYAARDQARPARDSKVGMLPPKLAQIIINLAAGRPELRLSNNWDEGDRLGRFLVLDPFCGTGVVLQEALLMGYSAYGTDIEPRMVEYTKKNLQWLVRQRPEVEGKVIVEPGDATAYQWLGFSCIASEVYLGRPLSKFPAEPRLTQIVNDVNTITKKFLENLARQLKSKHTICLAVPAWRRPGGGPIKLPLIDHLTDMGYTYRDLKHVRHEDLVYFREDQVVGRQLLRIRKQ